MEEQRTVVLACGGKKCCPQITFEPDGGVTFRDPDVEGQPVVQLSAEQTKKLQQLLNHRVR